MANACRSGLNHCWLSQKVVLLSLLWILPCTLGFVLALATPTTPGSSMASSAAFQATTDITVATSDSAAPITVRASVPYVESSTTVAHVGRDATGDDQGDIPVQWQHQTVEIHNVRTLPDPLQPVLHKHGAQLVEAPIVLEEDDVGNKNPIDFWDRQDVLKRYYPHCEALVRRCLAASGDDNDTPDTTSTPFLVRAFDHNVRVATDHDDNNNKELKNSGESKVQQPLQLVHGDYTKVSAPRRLQQLAEPPKVNDVWSQVYPDGLIPRELVEEALASSISGDNNSEKDKKGCNRRFLFLNVWRNIDPNRPVQAFPLACVDAASVREQDYRTLQIHYMDRVGENYLACYNPTHQWMYWDQMTHTEAMLILQWDSMPDEGCARLCLHSAFDLAPHISDVSKQRQSIEVRCVVIY